MCGSTVSIVGIAVIFGRVLALYQIPNAVGSLFLSITTNPVILQLLVLILMIFVGMWMEPLSSISIMVPIFLPLLKQMNIDLVAFGIILVVTTQIAFITPPVAANLFVTAQISNSRIEDLGREIIPFVCVLAGIAMLIIAFPQLATFIPTMLGG